MLEQEIGRLRGGTPSSARIETNVPCLVPSFYIPQEAIRITLYRRLLRVRGMEDVIELEREVADRFGPLPESLKNLFCVSLLRARGGEYGIVSMECSPAETVLTGEGPLFAALRGKKSWYGLTGKMVGPGGCTGLGDLLTVLRHMKQVHRNG